LILLSTLHSPAKSEQKLSVKSRLKHHFTWQRFLTMALRVTKILIMVFILIIKSDPQSKHQRNGIDIKKQPMPLIATHLK